MQETVPTDRLYYGLATQRARIVPCPLCWALPGRCCTISGPPADHLIRWLAAAKAGQVSRERLGAVIASLPVIADHVYVIEAAA